MSNQMNKHLWSQKNKNEKSSNTITSLKINIDLTINKAGSDSDEQHLGSSDDES